MKKYLTKEVLTTYLFVIFSFFVLSFSAKAQNNQSPSYENPDYGPDSISRISCGNNLSTVSEFMKINLPDYALPSWRKVFNDCPGSSKNIYISGVKIYQHLLSKASDEIRKNELFDTLMLIYDRRIEYFGDEGYVLGYKAVDIIRYKKDAYSQAYSAFSRSAEISGVETDFSILSGLVQLGSIMFKNNQIDSKEFLQKYFLCHEILEQKKLLAKSIPKVIRTESKLEKIIESTPIRDCQSLELFFTEKFSKEEANIELLNQSIKILNLSSCNNTKFFADLNEKLVEINQDPETAYEVAKYCLKVEDYEKAVKYLKLSINTENRPEKRALYQQQLALVLLSKLSSPKEARIWAVEATKNKTDWGEPYLLIASAFIEGAKLLNLDDFERQAIYWLAVDYCQKAKSIDPDIYEKANNLIIQYRSNYPNVEETFFRSLKEGDNYKFNSWINESTKVKIK